MFETTTPFLLFVRRALSPLVRLCLRRGVRLQEVVEQLKFVFVEEARTQLVLDSVQPSGSKISVMSGVHRKDVAMILTKDRTHYPQQSVFARIMTQWQHDSRFCVAPGQARVLSVEGKDSEFARLVRSINGEDINPYAVIFEMERLGIVQSENGHVQLRWQNYAPRASEDEGLEMLQSDVSSLIDAVSENIYQRKLIPQLHLRTEFDNVVPEAEPEIREWLFKNGSEFHQKARAFIAQFDRDVQLSLPRDGARMRVALGAFSHVGLGAAKAGEGNK